MANRNTTVYTIYKSLKFIVYFKQIVNVMSLETKNCLYLITFNSNNIKRNEEKYEEKIFFLFMLVNIK